MSSDFYTSNYDPNEPPDPRKCDHGISLSLPCDECAALAKKERK